MPLLQIDPERARETSTKCRALAGSADELASQALQAALLADLVVDGPQLLVAMADMLHDVARGLADAAIRTATFRLPTLAAAPTLRWNQTRQIASHNSYRSPAGLGGLYDRGVRAFELDLHRGAPTSRSIWQSPWELLADSFDHDVDDAGDWRIYHHSLDVASSYRDMSQALGELATFDSTEPITLFLDMKDRFAAPQDAALLDGLLRHHLGGRLFTPADLIARTAGATSLQQSLDEQGWPTVAELDGRIMVVLTDEVAEYRVRDGGNLGVAFVSAAPSVEAVGDPDVVFYNVHVNDISEHQVVALQRHGGVVRTWGAPAGSGFASNYLALDLEPTDE